MKKRILVIDDEELLTKSFALLLERTGYETYTVKNSQDAEAMFEEEDFDLIICDIRMPGKNGVETIKQIRNIISSNRKSSVPIIFVTGFADPELEAQAKALDPIAYIQKPFDVMELLNIVRKATESSGSNT